MRSHEDIAPDRLVLPIVVTGDDTLSLPLDHIPRSHTRVGRPTAFERTHMPCGRYGAAATSIKSKILGKPRPFDSRNIWRIRDNVIPIAGEPLDFLEMRRVICSLIEAFL